jgi:hypothetical protein
MEQLKEIANKSNISSASGLIATTALFILMHSILFSVLFVGSWIPNVMPEYALGVFTYVVFLTIEIVLVSSDTLYYGNPSKNRYARAFQKGFPSKHIAGRFHLSKEEAKFYWFSIFNSWANKEHPLHEQWKRTLRRGYSCRFIYYVIRFLEILSLSCVAVTLLSFVTFGFTGTNLNVLETRFLIQYVFTAYVLLLYLVIRLANRTVPGHLTGVWRRFAEINHLHIQWIDHNIRSITALRRMVAAEPRQRLA